MNLTLEELEDIWKDAKFEPKKPILKSAEIIKKEKIRKISSSGKTISYCKVCNKEMYLSDTYNGEYPLCKIHRDPNDRFLLKEKSKKQQIF